jgi:hypothetical protein
VFRGAGSHAEITSTTLDNAPVSTVRVAILNGDVALLAAIKPYAAQIEVVGAAQQADLLWDFASGDVISRLGDVVARNVKARDIADVIDRTVAIAAIKQLSEARPQRIIALPDDKHHRKDERISFRAEGVLDKYVILFNVASDGTVQFLYPKSQGDERKVPTPDIRPRPDNITVVAPFGADHIVAIVSDKQLSPLEEAVKAFDETRASGRMPAILRKYLPDDQSVRIGLTGLFTVP